MQNVYETTIKVMAHVERRALVARREAGEMVYVPKLEVLMSHKESALDLYIMDMVEAQGMAVETNIDRQPISHNLIRPTEDENKPIMVLERVSMAQIWEWLEGESNAQ